MRTSNTDCVAAFPMYDFDELTGAHDSLWTALAARLAAAHVLEAPVRLSRELEYAQVWRHPHLLLAQGCEFPLAKSIAYSIRVVASPHYQVPGCDTSRYCSVIVVPRDHPASRLADMRGTRCVINARDSNSGMNLLRAAVAPLAQGTPFFRSVAVSGAHRRSAEMISGGEADVAAIDCVTFAHLQRLSPAIMARVRVLGYTPSSPSLPYITGRTTSDTTLWALRTALKATMTDPVLAAVRASLFLVDFDIDPDPSFAEVLRLEREAIGWGYPVLE